MNASQPFCRRMTSIPTPYVVAHLTFVGSGYGWFILGKNFFPKPLELEFFSLTYNGVSFCSALYTL